MEIRSKEFGMMCQCIWEEYHRPGHIIEISSPTEYGEVKIVWTDSMGKHSLYRTIRDLMECVHSRADWSESASFEDICRTIPSFYGWTFSEEEDGKKTGVTGSRHLGYEWRVEEMVPGKLLRISGEDRARGIRAYSKEVPWGSLTSVCL